MVSKRNIICTELKIRKRSVMSSIAMCGWKKQKNAMMTSVHFLKGTWDKIKDLTFGNGSLIIAFVSCAAAHLRSLYKNIGVWLSLARALS